MSDPVSVAGLGLAVFESGRSILTSGSFSSSCNTVSFMHPNTPANATWSQVRWPITVLLFHPRYLVDWQVMKFRLIYEANGNDIRNARVLPLVDASSGLYSSSFNIAWGGQAHSRPNNPVSEIAFNISGEWDPVGRGDVSFDGQLIISAAKNGKSYEEFSITSEKNWVVARQHPSPPPRNR